MDAQLLELRKTLAKQAAFDRHIWGRMRQDLLPINYSYCLGWYRASRKAWWTVVEMMRND